MPPVRSLAPLLLLALAAGTSTSCGDGPTPPEQPRAATVRLSGLPATVIPGATVTLEIVVLDGQQRPLAGVAVRLEVLQGNGSVSPLTTTTDANGAATATWRMGQLAGLNRLRASSGDAFSVASLTSVQPAPTPVLTELQLGNVPPAARTGETIDLTVLALDQAGAPMSGVLITGQVLLGGGSVPPNAFVTTADGLATVPWTLGTEQGEQRLRLVSGDVSVEASLVAERPALGGFGTVTGSGQEGPVGRELNDPIVVQVVDTDGLPFAGLALTWRVIAGGGAVVPDGTATGSDGRQNARWTLGPSVGQQQLEVVADDGEGRSAGILIAATAFDGIRISTVLDPMRQGLAVQVALSARGGDEESGYSWAVVGGAPPPGVSLSGDGMLAGTPTAEGLFAFTVRATDALGVSGDRGYEARVCEGALVLGVGQSDLRTYPTACAALLPADAGAAYRVGVMARGGAGEYTEVIAGGLQLRTRVDGAAVTSAAVDIGRSVSAHQVPGVVLDDVDAGWLHRRTLDAAARAPRPVVRPAPSADGSRLAAAVAPPADRLDFRVVTPEGSIVTIGAGLRAFSETVAYYEDDGIAADGGTIYDLARIESTLTWHDAHAHPVLLEAFGGYGPAGTVQVFTDDDGVVQDRQVGDLDGNGRLIALQLRPSYIVGLQGFATGCDQVPRPEHATSGFPSCEVSNEGEIIYVRGPGRYLLAHEAKHVTSVAWTLYGGKAPQQGWIEEGTAVLSSELASRHASGVAPTQRVVAADVYVGGQRPPTEHDRYLMWAAVVTGQNYLDAAPFSAITGNPSPNPGGSSFYSASWLFHRFVIDAYGAGDPHGLMRRLNTVSGGVPGLEAETGRSLSELFTEFMHAVLVDDRPDARAASASRFESYDFADVLGADPAAIEWPSFVGTGGFATTSWDLPTWETSANLFEFTVDGGQAMEVEVVRGDGTPVGPEDDVGLLILRVQ